jgi:hypothetical protein
MVFELSEDHWFISLFLDSSYQRPKPRISNPAFEFHTQKCDGCSAHPITSMMVNDGHIIDSETVTTQIKKPQDYDKV